MNTPENEAMKKWADDKKAVDAAMQQIRPTADDDHHAMMNGARIAQSLVGRAAGAGVGSDAPTTEATDNEKLSDPAP